MINSSINGVLFVENKTLKDVEKEYILSVLAKTNWHKTKAAEILGITPRTLRNKLKEYNMAIELMDNDTQR